MLFRLILFLKTVMFRISFFYLFFPLLLMFLGLKAQVSLR
uniref:Uncharacterized protein n=1 Tax=uncultured Flavobacteriia bacterium TaxID=212695 RepID=H6RIG4_9BACT|nr:hypothetical protein VIS_S3CLB100025 [uncultured Flavobacteriia bacterium]